MTVDDFELISPGRISDIFGAIVRDGQNEIEETIDGAPTLTLTVHDADRKIRHLISKDKLQLRADGLDWEYAGTSKPDDTLTLTFEPLVVAELKAYTQKAKAARGKTTRAEFIRGRVVKIVEKHGGKFICPQLHKSQPIAGTSSSSREKDKNRAKGFAAGVKLRGKEGILAPSQVRNAETVLDLAYALGAPYKAILALVEACLVEPPDFKNPHTPSADGFNSYGILQARVGPGFNTYSQATDVKWCVRRFLKGPAFTGGRDGAIALARKHPDWDAGRIAQTIEGSAYGYRYGQQKSKAVAIIRAYGGGPGATTTREAKKYEFSQGPPGGPKDESAWAMAGRLAEEVAWRRFMVRNDFYYIAEADLMKSRVRAVISEGSSGVDRIKWDTRAGAKNDEATVECRAGGWKVPVGSIVEVEGEGLGNGKYLVVSVRRLLFDVGQEIQLRRKLQAAKDEPAPETRSTSSRSTGGSTGRGSSGKMQRPVSGGTISSNFGASRPGHSHAGVDIAVPVGTAVRAALGGSVTVVGYDAGGYGNWIEIRHANGLTTRYGHLSRALVKQGDRVSRGQLIGRSGNTGSSTGPHLHFEVRKNGTPVNPRSYI